MDAHATLSLNAEKIPLLLKLSLAVFSPPPRPAPKYVEFRLPVFITFHFSTKKGVALTKYISFKLTLVVRLKNVATSG